MRLCVVGEKIRLSLASLFACAVHIIMHNSSYMFIRSIPAGNAKYFDRRCQSSRRAQSQLIPSTEPSLLVPASICTCIVFLDKVTGICRKTL